MPAEYTMRTNHETGIVPDSKSARTRARILDAAAKVLGTKGYAGTRLSEVAREAEVQAPAIYYYWSSRDDLVEEVMWAGAADMRIHVSESLDKLPDGTPPIERIMAAVESHLRHELQISDYATATIRNAGQVPEAVRRRQMKEIAGYLEVWERLIASAVENRDIPEDIDPYIAQMLVLGALNWSAEWWRPERSSADDVVATAQQMLRRALTTTEKD